MHDNYYGTSLKPIKKALKENKLVIFDIDVQGHGFVRNRLGDITTSVFITPPSLKELKNRLEKRSLDSKEVIEKRLENAIFEIESLNEYDYIIVNDDLENLLNSLLP